MILDSSFLIDVMRGDPDALARADDLDAAGDEQLVPAMTVQELFIGVGASDLSEEERETIDRVLGPRPFVPTTEPIARTAGRIDGQLRRAGERINAGDAAIGATALLRDQPVVTGDPEHFRRIPDLVVETY